MRKKKRVPDNMLHHRFCNNCIGCLQMSRGGRLAGHALAHVRLAAIGCVPAGAFASTAVLCLPLRCKKLHVGEKELGGLPHTIASKGTSCWNSAEYLEKLCLHLGGYINCQLPCKIPGVAECLTMTVFLDRFCAWAELRNAATSDLAAQVKQA